MHDELLDTARAAADAGAAVLRRRFRSGDLQVRSKAENDFVTLADRESETAVVAEIQRRHPSHRILAEEGGGAGEGSGEYEWLVDPLDGTTNYLQGLPIYAISVACRRSRDVLAGVVYDPEGANLFTAAAGQGAHWNGRPMRVSSRAGLEGAFLATGYPFKAKATLDVYLALFRSVFLKARAIRRCGAAALDLAYTAAGVYDGFFEFRLSPWDLAAGTLLIGEAGGRVSDLDGGDCYLETGNVVAGAPGVHLALLDCARRHAGEARLAELEGALAGTRGGAAT